MNRSARLFYCARCHCQVLICSHCDWGNIYCAGPCAAQARSESMRAAGRKYQSSRKGRLANAVRQSRYRAQKEKVTHQGSQLALANVSLLPAPSDTIDGTKNQFSCHFCRCNCDALIRLEFLAPHRRAQWVEIQSTKQE